MNPPRGGAHGGGQGHAHPTRPPTSPRSIATPSSLSTRPIATSHRDGIGSTGTIRRLGTIMRTFDGLVEEDQNHQSNGDTQDQGQDNGQSQYPNQYQDYNQYQPFYPSLPYGANQMHNQNTGLPTGVFVPFGALQSTNSNYVQPTRSNNQPNRNSGRGGNQ